MDRYDLANCTLPPKWWQLACAALENEPFDCDEFLETFKETYALCREYTTKDSIHRDMTEIIINASHFISAKLTTSDYELMAACELTDAMLSHCFCESPKPAPTDKGTWCLCRDDFEIDFSNPEDELTELQKLLMLNGY